MSALSFSLHLCCRHLCFSVRRRLTIVWVPSPHGSVSPNTTTTTAVLSKNKRESVRHLPLDLFHTRAPTSVPDGVAFFQGFCQPQESSKWKTPPPLGAHYSAASHPPAPPPRAHGQGTSPLYLTPTGSPIKTINHMLFSTGACFQDIASPAVKT